MAKLPPHPDVHVGDILEWQNCPVLVLGNIRCDVNRWVARVAYLRLYDAKSMTVGVGEPLFSFAIANKDRWRGELTDDEVVLMMKLLLLLNG
jgi:hypothetical protein